MMVIVGVERLIPYGHFFELKYPCPNCGMDLWRRDIDVDIKRYGLRRYTCFHCAQDIYPGHRPIRHLEDVTH